MLPPVRTALSSSSSYQNQAAFAETGNASAEHATAGQLPGGRTGFNQDARDKLNALMLSGHEQMANDLSALADAIGDLISLPRREGETTADYTTRLSAALRSLTPEQRADVQKLLTQIVQGVNLKLLLDALKDTAGPEAARVVAFMELARYKDRDMAARSVVTSYRQNDSEQSFATPKSAVAPAPDTTANSEAANAAPAQSPRLTSDQASSSVRLVETAVAEQGGALPDQIASTESDEISNTTPAEEIMVLSAETETVQHEGEAIMRSEIQSVSSHLVETLPQAALLGRQVPAANAMNAGSARSLQEILQKAFDGGESGDAAIEAKATAEMMLDQPSSARPTTTADALKVAGQRVSVLPDAQFHAGANPARLPQVQDHDAAMRVSVPFQNADGARRGDVVQTMFVLKGWKEVSGADAIISAAILEEAALAEVLPSAADLKLETPASKALASTLPGRDTSDIRSSARSIDQADGQTSSSPVEDMARLPDEAASETSSTRSNRMGLPFITATEINERPQTAAQLAAAALTITGREAIPFATIPYPPAPATLTEEEAAEIRQRFEDSDDGSQEDGQEEAGHQQEPQDEAVLMADDMDDDEDGTSLPNSAHGDTAYGLYQRMAGWS